MPAPRVALDARTLAGPLSGLGRYTRTLLTGLAAHAKEPVLVLAPRQAAAWCRGLGTDRLVVQDVAERAADPLAQRRLSSRLAAGGVRVLHCPDAFVPLGGPLRSITTIHDLIPLRFSADLRRTAKGRFPSLWRRWLRVQCAAASVVAVVSEHTRDEVASLLGVLGEKVRVIPGAVEPVVGSPRRTPATEPRLLYVGRTPPYKNAAGAVRALSIVRRTVPRATLTIAGRREPRFPQAWEEARRLGVAAAVDFTGQVDEAELERLYRDAAALVFPSRAEGFGLPPLEAMARGVPVVAGCRASLPEVLGDAALLVDPDDDEAIAAAIVRVLTDASLARDLTERGIARAAAWSPARQAAAAEAVYQELCTVCG